MILKVEGIAHMKGVSKKTGNSYDFYTIHFLSKLRNVNGLAAMTKNISTDVTGIDRVIVGQHYNVETDLNGKVISITPAKT